jgi:hypothetical protein
MPFCPSCGCYSISGCPICEEKYERNADNPYLDKRDVPAHKPDGPQGGVSEGAFTDAGGIDEGSYFNGGVC